MKIVAWSATWLVVLGAPASEIWRGDDHPAALAVLMLAAFVGLYLALWWLASDRIHAQPLKLVLLLPLTGLALAGSLSFHRSWPFLFFFVSAAVACALPRKRALFGIAAVTAIDPLLMSSIPHAQVLRQTFGVLIAGLISLCIIRLLELVRELNAAREELARLAVADERVRFARDLHDLLGHTLSLIVVKSEAVRRLVKVDADAAERESTDIENVSRQALAEVREAVTNYRERSLDVELEGARVALSAAGIEATIHQMAERLPDTVESVLGWTVREGVTNVVRHSNGRHCAIELRQADGMAMLEISDDGNSGLEPGQGRDGLGRTAGAGSAATAALSSGSSGAGIGNGASAGASSGAETGADAGGGASRGGRAIAAVGGRTGSGLRGLAERLAAAHGRLEAGRRPDGGFRLAVTVPLEPERAETV